MSSNKPKVGIFGLTGCAGDQLQILNCEDELIRIAQQVDIVDWVMAKSENDHECKLDIAFVEGVVASEKDLRELRKIRERSGVLIALGTCAVWGGLPAMQNTIPLEVLQQEVYKKKADFLDTVEARPVTHFVKCEFLLPGCPIERHEFLRVVNSLLSGTVPELPNIPVCWSCKTKENLCRVQYFNEVCCGSMTLGGCNARCPSHGVPCTGCRGPLEEPNYDANITMFADKGLSWKDISRKMKNFSAPVWMKLGLKQEVDSERKS